MIQIRISGGEVNLEPDSVDSVVEVSDYSSLIFIGAIELPVLENFRDLAKRIEEDRGYEVEVIGKMNIEPPALEIEPPGSEFEPPALEIEPPGSEFEPPALG